MSVTLPVITTHPSSQDVDILQNATFTCIATGHGVIYQWTIGSGSFPNKVTGISSSTLVIPNVRPSDDNTYTCVISNDEGSISSNSVHLRVTGMTIIMYACVFHLYRSTSSDGDTIHSEHRGDA